MNKEQYEYNFEPISLKLTQFEQILSKWEQIRYIEHSKSFFKETAYLKRVDNKCSYYYLFSQIKSNDFNEGSGYLTHGFDFYRGSFHGQMIRGLINYCNLEPKSIILDPFCGCGTTLIEAKLLGFNAIGIDLNPIACLNSKIKAELLTAPSNMLVEDNEKYFNLGYYKKYSQIKDFNAILNQDIKELFYLFLYARGLAIADRFGRDLQQAFKNLYVKTTNVLKKFEKLKETIVITFGTTKIVLMDNTSYLKTIQSNFIDAIITSPPYVDLIDYIEEDIVQLRVFLNTNQIRILKETSIGNKAINKDLTEKNYWTKMRSVFKELYRVLKPKGELIFVIGPYKNMRQGFEDLSLEVGFKIERVLKREVVNIKQKQNIEYIFFVNK